MGQPSHLPTPNVNGHPTYHIDPLQKLPIDFQQKTKRRLLLSAEALREEGAVRAVCVALARSAREVAVLCDVLNVILHGGRAVTPSDELHLVRAVILVASSRHPVPFAQRRCAPPLP